MMLEKYQATIHGETITWDNDVPAAIKNGESVKVVITLSDNLGQRSKQDTLRAVAALQSIADRGGIKTIPDPVKWQREMREDRPLHGRK